MNLLIIGAGQYGKLVREIAIADGRFGKISFIDDHSDEAVGKTADIESFYPEYEHAIAAIGDPAVRGEMLGKLKKSGFCISTLIHPMAYVSPSAVIGCGCVIEPFAAVHTEAVVHDGCFISSGAVVNHNCTVGECSHIDCNASVMKASAVPPMTNVEGNSNWTRK